MDAITANISQLIVRLGSLVTVDEAEAAKRAERCRYLGHVPYRVPYRVPKLTEQDKAHIIG